jgi:hypothetical protein
LTLIKKQQRKKEKNTARSEIQPCIAIHVRQNGLVQLVKVVPKEPLLDFGIRRWHNTRIVKKRMSVYHALREAHLLFSRIARRARCAGPGP